MSRTLYEQAQNCQWQEDKKCNDAPLETGYVVFMKNFYSPCDAKPLFTFEHTKMDLPPESRNNYRFEELSFDIDQDFVCHGFAGYFETVLYKDIRLSINPSTHSKGMFSWFPIYFPILIPLFIPAKSRLKVCFWRQSDGHRVWYEWCISDPVITKIQNPGGKSSYISLHWTLRKSITLIIFRPFSSSAYLMKMKWMIIKWWEVMAIFLMQVERINDNNNNPSFLPSTASFLLSLSAERLPIFSSLNEDERSERKGKNDEVEPWSWHSISFSTILCSLHNEDWWEGGRSVMIQFAFQPLIYLFSTLCPCEHNIFHLLL